MGKVEIPGLCRPETICRQSAKDRNHRELSRVGAAAVRHVVTTPELHNDTRLSRLSRYLPPSCQDKGNRASEYAIA